MLTRTLGGLKKARLRLARASKTVKFLSLTSILLSAATLVSLFSHQDLIVETRRHHLFTAKGQIQEILLDSNAGSVTTVSHRSHYTFREIWELSPKDSSHRCHFVSASAPDLGFKPCFELSAEELKESEPTFDQNLFTVSMDGEAFAWINKGGEVLYRRSVSGPAIKVALPPDLRGLKPATIILPESDLLFVLFNNSRVRVFDLSTMTWREGGSKLHDQEKDGESWLGPWSTSSRSNVVTYWSLKTGALALLEYKTRGDHIDNRRWRMPGLTSRLAFLDPMTTVVGTKDGLLVTLPAKSSEEISPSVYLFPGSAVRSVIFLDRERVLAAGDFPGVYLVEDGFPMRQILNCPPGASTLVTDGTWLAYARGREIGLAEFWKRREFDTTGTFQITAISAVLSVMSLFFSLIGEYRNTRRP